MAFITPSTRTGSSVKEVSDLDPISGYNADARYGNKEEKFYLERADQPTVTPGSWPERPVFTKEGDSLVENKTKKFFKAAKLANKYKEQKNIEEPKVNGKTPRTALLTNISTFGPPYGGLQLPSLGESGGKTGAVAYANKPGTSSGKPFNWLDSFG
jgi:hypothetical protein